MKTEENEQMISKLVRPRVNALIAAHYPKAMKRIAEPNRLIDNRLTEMDNRLTETEDVRLLLWALAILSLRAKRPGLYGQAQRLGVDVLPLDFPPSAQAGQCVERGRRLLTRLVLRGQLM